MSIFGSNGTEWEERARLYASSEYVLNELLSNRQLWARRAEEAFLEQNWDKQAHDDAVVRLLDAEILRRQSPDYQPPKSDKPFEQSQNLRWWDGIQWTPLPPGWYVSMNSPSAFWWDGGVCCTDR
jgi:hypothetical protein